MNDDALLSDRRSMWALASAVLSNVFLFFLIFGLSATVDYRCLQKQLHNKFAIATGVAMQFLFMPVLGYISVFICGKYGLTEAMGITLLVVTASPGGSYSNWWCSLFNADLALSVAVRIVELLGSFVSHTIVGSTDDYGFVAAIDCATPVESLHLHVSRLRKGGE